jgi:hypothetical protein
MNGGSISGNLVKSSSIAYVDSYGGLYVNNASATLTSVLIKDNGAYRIASAPGIFIDNGLLVMKNCYVVKNGYKDAEKDYSLSSVIIYAKGDTSVLDITDSTFESNGSEGIKGGCVIAVDESKLKINNSEFLNNATVDIISCDNSVVEITNSRFEGNAGRIFDGEVAEGSHFTDCTFSENTKFEDYNTFELFEGNKIAFNNCEFGNAVFNDRAFATFNGKAVASIFGEGSLSMILAILAIVASGVSIFLIVDMKKKLVPATADKTSESKDEE